MPMRHAGRLQREGHPIQVLRGSLPEVKPDSEQWEQRLPTSGALYPVKSSDSGPVAGEEVA